MNHMRPSKSPKIWGGAPHEFQIIILWLGNLNGLTYNFPKAYLIGQPSRKQLYGFIFVQTFFPECCVSDAKELPFLALGDSGELKSQENPAFFPIF